MFAPSDSTQTRLFFWETTQPPTQTLKQAFWNVTEMQSIRVEKNIAAVNETYDNLWKKLKPKPQKITKYTYSKIYIFMCKNIWNLRISSTFETHDPKSASGMQLKGHWPWSYNATAFCPLLTRPCCLASSQALAPGERVKRSSDFDTRKPTNERMMTKIKIILIWRGWSSGMILDRFFSPKIVGVFEHAFFCQLSY